MMIALNERDADRIAAHLRNELKEVEDAIGNLERLAKSFMEFADGDKIEVEIPTEEYNPVIGELQWDLDQKQFFLKCGEDAYEVADFNFYMKNPCQPDICKDFKHN